MKKKNALWEAGSGSISYVSYFIAILFTVILFRVFQFRIDVLVAKEICENGLHIVESGALTVNHDGIIAGVRDDSFESELDRAHIITSCTVSSSKTSQETQEVNKLGAYIQDAFKEQFGLENNTNPTGHLASLCGEDSDVLLSNRSGVANGVVVVYEPVYTVTTQRSDSGETVIFDDGTTVSKWIFDTHSTVEGWVEYDLYFTNNTYTGYGKSILTGVPILYNGLEAEGATIESTVNIEFDGVRRVIATNPTEGFFANNQDADHFSVKVTQAMDIVLARDDSRRR